MCHVQVKLIQVIHVKLIPSSYQPDEILISVFCKLKTHRFLIQDIVRNLISV